MSVPGAAAAEAERIIAQLRRAYGGPAWHGPSLRELLADVNAEQASARPLESAHSIWELVLHIAYWHRAVTRRLARVPVEPAPDEDWPRPTETGDAAWVAALASLEASVRELEDAIHRLAPGDFDRPLAGHPDDAYATLHGVVQHSLYHAGQIALLRKL